MMSEDFVASTVENVVWSHNETIDVDDIRMFVSAQIQAVREYLGSDLKTYYFNKKERVRGVSPSDCKFLAHDIVDFLIQDGPHPISVRKQCVEDAVKHMHCIVSARRSLFITDESKLKASDFTGHFMQCCCDNLLVFDFIEGRIQNTTNDVSRKPKI